MRVLGLKGCVLAIVGFVLLSPAVASAELKVGLNGYVKLDVLYNSRNFGVNNGPALVPLDVDSNATATQNARRDRRDNGETRFDARESRFTITATDKIRNVSMKGLLEIDFYGTEQAFVTTGSHGPRLFQAFAQADVDLGNKREIYILGGQTWSYFQNSEIAVPTTVDFNGPAGQLYARQPQLRMAYTVPINENNEFRFGVSVQQQSFVDFNGVNDFLADRGEGQDVPLFVIKGQWIQQMGYKGEIAFAVSRAKVGDENTTTGRTPTASQTVWGVQYSGSYAIGPVEPFLHVQYLSGLNREANGDFPDILTRIVGTRIEADPVKTMGGYAGVTYKLTPDTSFNVVYGFNEAKRNKDFSFGSTAEQTGSGNGISTYTDAALKRHQSIHANVMHNFWERFRVGVEFQRFWVKSFNGQDGSVNAGHGGFWFFF